MAIQQLEFNYGELLIAEDDVKFLSIFLAGITVVF